MGRFRFHTAAHIDISSDLRRTVLDDTGASGLSGCTAGGDQASEGHMLSLSNADLRIQGCMVKGMSTLQGPAPTQSGDPALTVVTHSQVNAFLEGITQLVSWAQSGTPGHLKKCKPAGPSAAGTGPCGVSTAGPAAAGLMELQGPASGRAPHRALLSTAELWVHVALIGHLCWGCPWQLVLSLVLTRGKGIRGLGATDPGRANREVLIVSGSGGRAGS
ncbi:unnamed protein product [Lota lota]